MLFYDTMIRVGLEEETKELFENSHDMKLRISHKINTGVGLKFAWGFPKRVIAIAACACDMPQILVSDISSNDIVYYLTNINNRQSAEEIS